MNEQERVQRSAHNSPRSIVNRIRDATTPAEAERLLRGFIDAHVAHKEREARADELRRIPWHSNKRYGIERPGLTKKYWLQRLVDLQPPTTERGE